ncbi:tyrosine-protein phosphatase [Microbacterium sp. No. 7]|uniref:tyrosine-protein phosphatase n=1 Tax=Microbacterium sp. No. 7 TaxID=1714373 RepID=UPI0006CFC1E0|nr:tyrosine-protein phosphatase [Microbacterium sp. No. 7]ALJ21630.1 transcriptional regulator [Microbacterium sp. No. 7]
MTTLDIRLSPPVNLRDLGGTPVAGTVVRPGVAIRTDDLSIVTPEYADALVADGLTAVIDLRSPQEAGITGRGPLGAHAVSYHHLPLMSNVGEGMDRERPVLDHAAMGEMYVGMVENAAPQLVTALSVIAHTPGTAAFHCAAGRDRTGVLAAMLLLVLGASDETIVEDYARTGPHMPAIVERTRTVMQPLLLSLGFDLEKQGTVDFGEGSMDVSMHILLSRLRDRHADPLAPLRRAGLSDDTTALLRRRALV